MIRLCWRDVSNLPGCSKERQPRGRERQIKDDDSWANEHNVDQATTRWGHKEKKAMVEEDVPPTSAGLKNKHL